MKKLNQVGEGKEAANYDQITYRVLKRFTKKAAEALTNWIFDTLQKQKERTP